MRAHKRDPHHGPCGELGHTPKRDLKRDVVDAAVALLDRYGIGDLSMRRLARELELTPGALYWHFADKQALLGAVADRLLTPVRAAGSGAGCGEGWQNRIEELCRRLRDALLSHTDGAELVSASLAAGRSPRIEAVTAALAAAAAEGGLDPEQSELAARSILYYVLGFTVDEQSRRQWDAAGASVAATDLGADGPRARPDRDFGFGLRLLTDGLAVRAGAALS